VSKNCPDQPIVLVVVLDLVLDLWTSPAINAFQENEDENDHDDEGRLTEPLTPHP